MLMSVHGSLRSGAADSISTCKNIILPILEASCLRYQAINAGYYQHEQDNPAALPAIALLNRPKSAVSAIVPGIPCCMMDIRISVEDIPITMCL